MHRETSFLPVSVILQEGRKLRDVSSAFASAAATLVVSAPETLEQPLKPVKPVGLFPLF